MCYSQAINNLEYEISTDNRDPDYLCPAGRVQRGLPPFPPTAPTPGQAAHDRELAELRKMIVPIRSPRCF